MPTEKPPMTTRRTYNAKEVAERLGRHPESIRRNLRDGDLEGERFGKEWVVTDEALRDWLPTPLYDRAFGNDHEEA